MCVREPVLGAQKCLFIKNLLQEKSNLGLSPVYGHDLLIHGINMKKNEPFPQIYKVKTSNKST